MDTRVIGVRLPPEIVARLEAMERQTRLSRSELLRRIIITALQGQPDVDGARIEAEERKRAYADAVRLIAKRLRKVLDEELVGKLISRRG